MLMLGHVGNDPSIGQLHDSVCIALSKIAVVRNNEHQLFLGQIFERIKDLLTRVGIQCTRGLIRHDDLRLLYQRSCNRNSLLLSAGELIRFSLGIVQKVDLGKDLVDLLGRRLLALELQRKRNIRTHRKIIQHVIFLENKPDEGVSVGIKVGSAKIL